MWNMKVKSAESLNGEGVYIALQRTCEGPKRMAEKVPERGFLEMKMIIT